MNRKSSPRVKDGRVQKKNRWTPTSTYYNTDLRVPMIDRRRPGEGYRHLLKRGDIERFIEIIPEWDELSKGLNAIVLAPGYEDRMGWHRPGVVHICAWEEDLWWDADPSFINDHRDILDRLDVVIEERPEDDWLVKWTEGQARAFQLLHILLHELGHHHDRMTTRSRQGGAPRGEPFAETYARRYEHLIWDDYLARFGADLLA